MRRRRIGRLRAAAPRARCCSSPERCRERLAEEELMMRRVLIPLAGMALCAFVLAQSGEAWARAGGGGSRGSRSYSSPVRPTPANPGMPSSPSRSYNQPAPAAASQPRSGLFGGLMGGLAGFALGGLLGSLLFGGLGHGFGIGLFDILLIGGGIL